MGVPISPCPDFKGQGRPSQNVKISAHLHPTVAPEPQQNLTKWGWCCQWAAGLGSRRSKPWHDAGPGWQRPCTTTSPTEASSTGTCKWQPGMEGQQEHCKGRPSQLSPGRQLRSSRAIRVCRRDFPTFSFVTTSFSHWDHWEFMLVAVVGLALII